jgi:hypothetical protein
MMHQAVMRASAHAFEPSQPSYQWLANREKLDAFVSPHRHTAQHAHLLFFANARQAKQQPCMLHISHPSALCIS